MFEDYFSFLDYRAAKRRIQAKLAKPHWLALHILVFAAGIQVAWMYGWSFQYHYHNLVNDFHVFCIVWSMILLAHALFSVVRSGLWPNRRTDLVEAEMRHLIQEQEDYETLRQQDLFEIHNELENEIKSHARPFIPLTLFAIVNVIFWLTNPWPYVALAPLIAAIILALYVITAFVVPLLRPRSRPARRLETSSQPVGKYKGKRKPAEYLTLADDGELVELHDEEWNTQSTQRS